MHKRQKRERATGSGASSLQQTDTFDFDDEGGSCRKEIETEATELQAGTDLQATSAEHLPNAAQQSSLTEAPQCEQAVATPCPGKNASSHSITSPNSNANQTTKKSERDSNGSLVDWKSKRNFFDAQTLGGMLISLEKNYFDTPINSFVVSNLMITRMLELRDSFALHGKPVSVDVNGRCRCHQMMIAYLCRWILIGIEPHREVRR